MTSSATAKAQVIGARDGAAGGHTGRPRSRRPVSVLRGVAAGVLLALPCAAQDAGIPPAVYAERAQYLLFGGNWEEGACTATEDGGSDCSGAWLPSRRLIATGKELADLRAENEALKATPQPLPPLSWFSLAMFGLGLVAGALGIGYLWWSFGR